MSIVDWPLFQYQCSSLKKLEQAAISLVVYSVLCNVGFFSKAKKYISFRCPRTSLQNLRINALFFNLKKIPLFFSYKRVCKTLPNLTILYPKTCVTYNMSDSL